MTKLVTRAMSLSANVTVAMPIEMVEKIDTAIEGTKWSRARYIRHCVNMADGSPFETPEDPLPTVDELQANEAGGVA